MQRVRLIHWKPVDAADCVRRINEAGFRCLLDEVTPALLRSQSTERPDAFVIDLSRLPMQGRDVGVALRHKAATRGIPLVYADGEPEKIERIRSVLPDAIYCEWTEIAGALKNAMAVRGRAVVAPESTMAAYAVVPLAQKLGLRPGMRVHLIAPPEEFDLIDLCPEVRIAKRGPVDLALWFVRSAEELEAGLEKWAASMPAGGLWILYPRQKAGTKPDPLSLTQPSVRKAAQRVGLADYKVVRVDGTWTGLRFAVRKAAKSR